jgi:hypothetical protein
LRRYTLLAITGIAVEGDDDDGASVGTAERAEMRQEARAMRSGRQNPAEVAAQRQPAPAAPDAQLLDDAKAAADKGRAAFDVFWKSINGAKRTALGVHLDDFAARCDVADRPALGAK